MIAVDACVVISFLAGESGDAVDAFARLLATDEAVLAPSTVTELLSDPKGGPEAAGLIDGLAVLALDEGYWRRAGLMRADVRRRGRKAALGDALLAQACLDTATPLLTLDRDFVAFAQIAGLSLFETGSDAT